MIQIRTFDLSKPTARRVYEQVPSLEARAAADHADREHNEEAQADPGLPPINEPKSKESHE